MIRIHESHVEDGQVLGGGGQVLVLLRLRHTGQSIEGFEQSMLAGFGKAELAQ